MASRPKRSTAGNKLAALIAELDVEKLRNEEEANEDSDVLSNATDASAAEEEEEEEVSGDEESDEEEDEQNADEEEDEEKMERQMKRKINRDTRKRKKSSSTATSNTVRTQKAAVNTQVNQYGYKPRRPRSNLEPARKRVKTLESNIARQSSRTASILHSQNLQSKLEMRQKQREALDAIKSSRPEQPKQQRLTQSQMLEEAMYTEQYNIESLEVLKTMQLTSRFIPRKRPCLEGSVIRWHSKMTIYHRGTEQIPAPTDQIIYLNIPDNQWKYPTSRSDQRTFTKNQTCIFTGLAARYIHPSTRIPYANHDAFKKIQELIDGKMVWDDDLEMFVEPYEFPSAVTPSDTNATVRKTQELKRTAWVPPEPPRILPLPYPKVKIRKPTVITSHNVQSTMPYHNPQSVVASQIVHKYNQSHRKQNVAPSYIPQDLAIPQGRPRLQFIGPPAHLAHLPTPPQAITSYGAKRPVSSQPSVSISNKKPRTPQAENPTTKLEPESEAKVIDKAKPRPDTAPTRGITKSLPKGDSIPVAQAVAEIVAKAEQGKEPKSAKRPARASEVKPKATPKARSSNKSEAKSTPQGSKSRSRRKSEPAGQASNDSLPATE